MWGKRRARSGARTGGVHGRIPEGGPGNSIQKLPFRRRGSHHTCQNSRLPADQAELSHSHWAVGGPAQPAGPPRGCRARSPGQGAPLEAWQGPREAPPGDSSKYSDKPSDGRSLGSTSQPHTWLFPTLPPNPALAHLSQRPTDKVSVQELRALSRAGAERSTPSRSRSGPPCSRTLLGWGRGGGGHVTGTLLSPMSLWKAGSPWPLRRRRAGRRGRKTWGGSHQRPAHCRPHSALSTAFWGSPGYQLEGPWSTPSQPVSSTMNKQGWRRGSGGKKTTGQGQGDDVAPRT